MIFRPRAIKKIVLAYWMLWTKGLNQVALKRLEVCNKCDSNIDMECIECGCALEAKTMCPDCECPLKKW